MSIMLNLNYLRSESAVFHFIHIDRWFTSLYIDVLHPLFLKPQDIVSVLKLEGAFIITVTVNATNIMISAQGKSTLGVDARQDS